MQHLVYKLYIFRSLSRNEKPEILGIATMQSEFSLLIYIGRNEKPETLGIATFIKVVYE